jgi:hypothetical protein
MKPVLIPRTIFAVALSLAMAVSVAPGNPAQCAAATAKAHDCCKKHQPTNATPKKGDCGGRSCAMQCCLVIPAATTAAPKLVASTTIVEMAIVTPATLKSLADPDTLFHPPRV